MLYLPRLQSPDRHSTGFTLAEILTVLTIIGIMCAIAVPSFLSIQGNAKLNSSLGIVRDTLEITQFRASQKKKDAAGNTCRIYIKKNQNKIIGNCLVSSSGSSTGVTDDTSTIKAFSSPSATTIVDTNSLDGWAVVNLDGDVTIDDVKTDQLTTDPITGAAVIPTPGMAAAPPRIVYNLQGLTQDAGTIVLVSASNQSIKKCLKIDAGIGLIRSGNYDGSTCNIITE